MPAITTGKSAAALDAKKKTSKAKDKDNGKEKKGSKDKAAKKSSEREKSKRKSDDKATPSTPATQSAATPSAPTPAPVDPDAVQLFRRYDRTRAGVMLRSEFLRLLRDYASAPRAVPLSLTDSRGVPLGYERAERNSEFEAGQLFERYDKARVGALSLEAFGEFFRDFQTQLRGFADELSYASAASVHPTLTEKPAPPQPTATEKPAHAPSPTEDRTPPAVEPSAPSVRAEYQATLWELRKICKDELAQQRERIRGAMARVRDRLTSPRPRGRDEEDDDGDDSVRGGDREHWRRPARRAEDDAFAFSRGRTRSPHWSPSSWADNQLMDRYDAMESDLERVDDVLRTTRRQLRKGLDASMEEMKAFLKSAPELLADARELAMKVYDTSVDTPPLPRRERVRPEERNASPVSSPRDSRQEATDRPRSAMDKAGRTLREDRRDGAEQATATVEQLQKTLRIKDQLIYQLLQERTTLRRQKASAESDLQELSQVSTHEMRKWAQLTDEMQQEIALLHNRLSRLDRRSGGEHDDDEDDFSQYAYTQRHA